MISRKITIRKTRFAALMTPIRAASPVTRAGNRPISTRIRLKTSQNTESSVRMRLFRTRLST